MDQVRKFLVKFYDGVGTTRAKRLKGLVLADQWELLQKETLSAPSVYQNYKAFYKDALVVEIARKLLLPGDKDRRIKAAEDTFWVSEAQCALTNTRLTRHIRNGALSPLDMRASPLIEAWRKEIKRVLGRCSHYLEPGFSGGSTLSDRGKLTTIPDKMSSCPTAYHGFPPELHLMLKRTVLDRPIMQVAANKFFTVPKDSQKDRGCCVEASLNVAFQLAVGRQIKKRYRDRYGVDLRHAQPLHRKLAQQASSGAIEMATIDLSNASDTVAKRLIELLLPRDWYALLNSLRAKKTDIDGKTVFLEKFSSMGNGFTFELETLLFRSLLSALGTHGYVYGDDIIVPTARAADVLAALTYFGFTPNAKKTFCEGPFRESCGGDFFNGKAVRPHYLKEIPDEPQKWVALANGIRRADHFGCLRAAWWFCIDQLPREWRNFGPEDLGDTLIHVDQPEPSIRKWKTREWCNTSKRHISVEHGYAGFYRVMRPVSQKFALGDHWSYDVAVAAACIGVPSNVTPRDSITGYTQDWVRSEGLADLPSWWLD